MKKIINGSLYNTDTARIIGEWDNGYNGSDFNFCRETLHKTKAGKYFLHGEGGPMSKYSESRGNNEWGSGEHIEPLTPETAQEWAEEHLTADEYAAAFGEPEEAAEGREAMNLSVPTDLKVRLEKLRSEKNMSISQLVEVAVREQYGI